MPSTIAPTRLEPVSPHNAVLLLVDQQEGLFSRIHDPEQTRRNLLALARSAQLLGMPVVMTTALAAGPNGPQLKELTETFAGGEIIDRTLINAWQDSRVRDAITRTGRNKVIIAGTGLDVCAQLPALASAAEGYDSYVVIDASGRFEPVPSVAAVSRLTQAGVALVNTRVIVLETMADNAHPKAKEIYATLPAGLVVTDEASPPPMANATEDTVRTLQDRVNAALLGSDWETLNELIAPDARIIGPRGFVINRDTWIGVHEESEYEQVRLEPTETDVRTYDNAGIRFDVVESECTYKGETITGRFRVTQVWVTDHDRWQLAAVQYTSLP